MLSFHKTALVYTAVFILLIVGIAGAVYFNQYLSTQVSKPSFTPQPEEPEGQFLSQAKQYPEIVSDKVAVRLSPEQAIQLTQALEDIRQPAVLAETDTPEATATPTPSSEAQATTTPTQTSTLTSEKTATTSPTSTPEETSIEDPAIEPTSAPVPVTSPVTPAQRVTVAKSSLSFLSDIDFTDIKPPTPVKLKGSEYQHNVNRWFTIQLDSPDTRQIIPIRLEDSKDPLSFEATTAEYFEQLLTPPEESQEVEQPPAEIQASSQHVSAVSRIKGVFSKLEAQKQSGSVEVYEPIYMVYVSTVNPSDDTYYPTHGAWGQTDYDDLYGIKQIQSESAWELSDGEGVVVAVVDTGVDYNHEDIAENMWTNPGETGTDESGNDKRTNGLDDDNNGYIDDWRGWDFYYYDNDPLDGHGHGTHVAGTIAAVDNDKGVIGVAPKAKIMAVKGLSDQGGGTDDTLKDAVRYSAVNGADILNNSWGGRGVSQQLEDAFDYAYSIHNAVSIAAAGNGGHALMVEPWEYLKRILPASYDTVITVAATDHEDNRAWFSNFGIKADVAAPGTNTLSLRAQNTDIYLGSTGYTPEQSFVPAFDDTARYYRASGTSMSAPHVAGVAALVLSKLPGISNEEVREILRQSADPIETDRYIGNGRLNARRAVDYDIPPPLARIITPHSNYVEEDSYATDRSISIVGTAAGTNFTNYIVEVSTDPTAGQWTQENIVLTNNGNSPVEKDILATWNIGAIAAPADYYTIRLTVNSTAGQSTADVRDLYIDTDIRAGWPIEMRGLSAIGQPKIAIGNIDEGPEKEIIVTVWASSGSKIFAYDEDGSLLEGWPVYIDKDKIEFLEGFPILYDLNDDGKDEIIVTSGTSKTYIFQGNGTYLPGWPQQATVVGDAITISFGMPAIADLDNNGSPEIIHASNLAFSDSVDNKIILEAWHIDGTPVTGWPKYLDSPGEAKWYRGKWSNDYALTAADADGDGDIELFFIANSNLATPDDNSGSYILAVDHNGNMLPGWPVALATGDAISSGALAVGNVSGNNQAEIVVVKSLITFPSVAADYNDASINIYNLDGTFLSPWPLALKQLVSVHSSPTLFDLDGDGLKDIIFGRNAFKGDGTRVNGWLPLLPDPRVWDQIELRTGTAIADVTGDAVPEIILRQPRVIKRNEDIISEQVLRAFGLDGQNVVRWPKPLTIYYRDSKKPVRILADDLDSNGTIELVAVFPMYSNLSENYHVVVYNTPGLASAGTWPMMNKDAQHRRGYSSPGTVVKSHIFYNNSSFDNNDPAINDQDKYAIAPDKQALKPGQTATFRNYTSYSKGINGIMVDINEPANGESITAADFEFKTGNSDDPSSWSQAPAPNNIAIEPFMGTDQSDRITITWDDNVIQKQWLRVTVKATENTSLFQDEVFYYGNAIAETGNSDTDAKVDAIDMLGARDNQRNFLNPAPLNFNFDFDRNARVGATDMLIARNNTTHFLNALKLIAVP